MPTLTLIAGPNGAGKSTITRVVDIEGIDCVLDPDAIARRINRDHPAAAALAAGREVLRRQGEYFRAGVSFAVENYSRRRTRPPRRRGEGPWIPGSPPYVGVNSPERSIARIRYRVAQGGHFVPDEDVRRRYKRSMANARDLVLRVDAARLYDNSGNHHRLVLAAQNGVITFRADPLPPWLVKWGV